ncbi:hypothetical protein BDZ91DRAFT_523192 [Kalaharituber pfeilii]|nr:hypothetical protein BDZ91DRAFT_523192 [Kalaharituber pfeilii]
MVLLVLDEAANIPGTILPSIRHLLRVFTLQPLWTLFLSTYNSIPKLQPALKEDPSARIRRRQFERHEPFVGLQLDIELDKRFGDQELAKEELSKPLGSFATPDHLTLFGRPLWRIHSQSPLETLCSFVEMKLLGGTVVFDFNNQNHVFAVLSFRILLDPCINCEESTKLVTESVNSHLRLVIGMDQEASSFRTISPSEPIVAHVAASLLMGGGYTLTSCQGRDPTLVWSRSITILSHLLARGVVDKGLKGELLARILVILTRDFMFSKSPGWDPVTFNWSQSFRALDFLASLIHPSYHSILFDFLPMTTPTRSTKHELTDVKDFKTTFNNARMNMNHFTSTETHLLPENVPELLWELMRQCAGLQLSGTQPAWDLLIPMYLGPEMEPFDPNYLSAIAIQVKNTKRKNKLRLGAFETAYFRELQQPVITILIDFGVSSDDLPKCLYASGSMQKGTACWGMQLQGSGSGVWNVLGNMNLDAACKELRSVFSAPEQDDSLHFELCNLNNRFNRHTRSERFIGCFANEDSDADAN